MIFKPRPLSRTMLDDASLVRDKQHCRRIGPCGVGRRALYLNSYFIDRHYYVPFSAITRAFKFIEEGTGGVRGVLAGRACLLVEYDGGMQQVCCFKYEDQIDELLRVLHKMHPEIPCVARRRLNSRSSTSVGGRKNADDRHSAYALSGRLRSWRMRSHTSSASLSCTSGSVVQPNGGATTREGARDTAGRLQRSLVLRAAH